MLSKHVSLFFLVGVSICSLSQSVLANCPENITRSQLSAFKQNPNTTITIGNQRFKLHNPAVDAKSLPTVEFTKLRQNIGLDQAATQQSQRIHPNTCVYTYRGYGRIVSRQKFTITLEEVRSGAVTGQGIHVPPPSLDFGAPHHDAPAPHAAGPADADVPPGRPSAPHAAGPADADVPGRPSAPHPGPGANVPPPPPVPQASGAPEGRQQPANLLDQIRQGRDLAPARNRPAVRPHDSGDPLEAMRRQIEQRRPGIDGNDNTNDDSSEEWED